MSHRPDTTAEEEPSSPLGEALATLVLFGLGALIIKGVKDFMEYQPPPPPMGPAESDNREPDIIDAEDCSADLNGEE